MTDDKIRISWDDISTSATSNSSPRDANRYEPNTDGATAAPSMQWLQARVQQPKFVLMDSYFGVSTSVIVGAAIFLACILFFVVRNVSSSDARQIEAVLMKDAETTVGAKTVAEIAGRMRSIDLSHCPTDFRSAYLSHVHAWESCAQIVQEQEKMNSGSQFVTNFLESMIRGSLGDPFGKTLETMAASNEIQQKLQSARQQIQDSFHRVQEIAVAHGATLPNRNQAR